MGAETEEIIRQNYTPGCNLRVAGGSITDLILECRGWGRSGWMCSGDWTERARVRIERGGRERRDFFATRVPEVFVSADQRLLAGAVVGIADTHQMCRI